jgi:hypothetical protein
VSRRKGSHEGKAKPGNPGYRQNTGGYEGRHEKGCFSIALPAGGAALAGLGAVLAILWRAIG